MLPINKTYIVNKDTTEFNNNNIIKKGTIVKGVFSGSMPNGEIRITTDKGEIIKYSDLQEQPNNYVSIPIGIADKPQQPLMKNMDVLTPEDKLYEMFGIKYHNTHMFGVASRMKGRFYLAVVLVAGYFAYKKFKK